MLAFTILALYAVFGVCLLTRANARFAHILTSQGLRLATLVALFAHAAWLGSFVFEAQAGLNLANVIDLIALLLVAIGILIMARDGMRPIAGMLLIIAAILVLSSVLLGEPTQTPTLSWQLKLHALTSLTAYALLAAGVPVAIAALAAEKRLRRAQLSGASAWLPPLEASQRLLADLCLAGTLFLLLAVTSGFVFVENLFAQHLVHKSVLSIAALIIFGILTIGQRQRGWRSRRMVIAYLTAFGILVLAYFGSKFVLEVLLERQWG